MEGSGERPYRREAYIEEKHTVEADSCRLAQAREVRRSLVGRQRWLPTDLIHIDTIPVAHEQIPHGEARKHLEHCHGSI